MRADLDELVHRAHAREDRPFTDSNMTRYLGVVARYAVISYDTVVREMAIRHDQAIFADDGLVPFLGSPVYRNKLADRGTITDNYVGILALELEVLRDGRDHGAGEDPAVLADPGTFHNSYIGTDPGTIADLDVLVDDRKWVNFHIRGQLSVRVYIRMRVNHGTRKGNRYGQKPRFFWL